MEKLFETPILFLIFNRLETTAVVFDEIKKIKPKKLFIAADGPRSDVTGEKEICEKTRKYVLDNVNWECEVRTLFRDKNMGCGRAVSGAITWFFNNVDKGIILEDDCLPNESFFYFCDELLERYEDEDRIKMISGCSFYPDKLTKKWGDYGFVKIPHIWGWASWSRAWRQYDYYMKDLESDRYKKIITNAWQNKIFYKEYWMNIFLRVKNNEIDTWDYQWVYSIWKENGFCVAPSLNLISNIGFGSGTHTRALGKKNILSELKIHRISMPSKTDIHLEPDHKADNYNMNKIILKNEKIKLILKILKLYSPVKKIYKFMFPKQSKIYTKNT